MELLEQDKDYSYSIEVACAWRNEGRTLAHDL